MNWDHRFWCELLKVRIVEIRIIKVPLYDQAQKYLTLKPSGIEGINEGDAYGYLHILNKPLRHRTLCPESGKRYR